ncbi:MAG: hypothetical protein IJ604_14115 [Prevotella sp.]|nr:hypothetical protein [Prevotella sp.]MBR1464496.1 hypothetical protein [Prevotella sp.]
MKSAYIKPVLEITHIEVKTAMLAGSRYPTAVRFGLSSDDPYNFYKGTTFFGNDSWVNEGYAPGTPAQPGGDGVLIIGEDDGNMNSRGKRSLWDDDEY